MERNDEIIDLSRIAQSLIDQLYSQNPNDETFEQSGIACGEETVKGYIYHNEPNVALEHLLYIIYESNISFPTDKLKVLHEIVEEYGVITRYY